MQLVHSVRPAMCTLMRDRTQLAFRFLAADCIQWWHRKILKENTGFEAALAPWEI